jgi:hypothetical protein
MPVRCNCYGVECLDKICRHAKPHEPYAGRVGWHSTDLSCAEIDNICPLTKKRYKCIEVAETADEPSTINGMPDTLRWWDR